MGQPTKILRTDIENEPLHILILLTFKVSLPKCRHSGTSRQHRDDSVTTLWRNGIAVIPRRRCDITKMPNDHATAASLQRHYETVTVYSHSNIYNVHRDAVTLTYCHGIHGRFHTVFVDTFNVAANMPRCDRVHD